MRKLPGRCRVSILATGAFALFVAFLVAIAIPNHIHNGPGKTTGVFSNLRQLDGAIQMWAVDHHATGAVVVSRQDVAPYLRATPEGWVKPVAGEVYFVKSLAQSPEAVLTREVDGRPKGTVLRLGTNGDLQFILPEP
jgi:hypothetical protein